MIKSRFKTILVILEIEANRSPRYASHQIHDLAPRFAITFDIALCDG